MTNNDMRNNGFVTHAEMKLIREGLKLLEIQYIEAEKINITRKNCEHWRTARQLKFALFTKVCGI